MKKILREIKIDEISAVDSPAQEGAKAILIKRKEEDLAKIAFQEALTNLKLEDNIREAVSEMWVLNEALRVSVQQIIEDRDQYPDPNKSVKESLAQFANAVASMVADTMQDVGKRRDDPKEVRDCVIEKTNAYAREHGKPVPQDVIAQALKECRASHMSKASKTENGESFPSSDFAFVPDSEKSSTWKLRLTSTPGGSPDPRIVGAAVAALGPGFRGQKVEIPESARAGVIKKVRAAWLEANPDKGNDDLPDVLKKYEEEANVQTIEQLEKELTYAKAYGNLNDMEKRHAATLSQADRDKFVMASGAERTAELAKRDAADPVVYESTDGTKYRASDDPRLVTMAKRSDISDKAAQDSIKAVQEADLQKRATELSHLPGDDKVRIAALRAIDTIEDADLRKSALEMLKAQDATLAEAYKTRGITALKPASSAEQQLETLAKRVAEERKISSAQAYDAVLKTEEGKRLYAETVNR